MFMHPIALGAAVFFGLIALAPDTGKTSDRIGRGFLILIAAIAAGMAVS